MSKKVERECVDTMKMKMMIEGERDSRKSSIEPALYVPSSLAPVVVAEGAVLVTCVHPSLVAPAHLSVLIAHESVL